MGENSSDFREALAELVDATYPAPAEHPSAERWLAYQRGELPAEEEARLQDHLVRCRDCFDLAQAAEAFASADEEPGAAGERDSAAPAGQLREMSAYRPRPPALRLLRSYAAAAALAVALAGSLLWNVHQHSALTVLRTPQANVDIEDFSAGERHSSSGGVTEVTKVAGTGPWVFIFHPEEELHVYRLSLRDAATGKEIDAYELRPNADFALTLELPEGLPPGRYRLVLADGRVPQEKLLHVTEAGRGG